MKLGALLSASLLSMLASAFCSGGVSLQLIDRGVPTDGTTIATGYSAFTLRITSDVGVIAAVDLTQMGGISGPLVQRWFSTNEDGVYDQSTPGFATAQNLTPSPMNFDSHFLSSGSTLTAVSPVEDARFGPIGSQLGTFPANTMLAGVGTGIQMRAGYGVVNTYQSSSMDLAYLVIPNTGTVLLHAWVSPRGSSVASYIDTSRAWNGQSDTWDSDASRSNWNLWGHGVAFNPGDDVQFADGVPARAREVHVASAGVTPRHLSVTNTGGNYVVDGGPINSSGSFLKHGAGAVTFNNPVTFAGTGLIDGGSVYVNNTFSIPKLSLNGGTLGGHGTVSGIVTPIDSIIAPGDPSATGSLTIANLNILSYVNVSFRLSTSGNDQLNLVAPLPSGPYDTSCRVSDAGGAKAGTFTLIDYAGAALPNLDFVKLSTPAIGGFVGTLINNTANTSVDLLLTPGPAWKLDSDGTWSSMYPDRWTGGVPNSYGMPANFGPVISAARTVNIPSSGVYAGELRFDSPFSYTLSGSGRIALGAGKNLDGPSYIEVVRGSHTIATWLSLESVIINVMPATSQLTLSGLLEGALTKTGAGTLRLLGHASLGADLSVQAGTLVMNSDLVLTALHKSADCYVADGAALAGSGTITTGVFASAGAMLAPGESAQIPAMLTVGRLSLSDALLAFDFANGHADELAVTGSNQLLLDGVSTISINASSAIPEGEFRLLDYTGTPILDTGHLVLATDLPDGQPMTLVYNSATTSIDLLVGNAAQVPEPATLMLMLTCLLLHSSSVRRSSGYALVRDLNED